jgi:hypothetical protein
VTSRRKRNACKRLQVETAPEKLLEAHFSGDRRREAASLASENTVVLVPWNGAPVVISAGTAAGTTCTFAAPPPGFPNTVPVVIING